MPVLPDNSLPRVVDVIASITEVLLSTGDIATVCDGRQAELSVWPVACSESLQDFHPPDEAEKVRELKLATLSDEQRGQLD